MSMFRRLSYSKLKLPIVAAAFAFLGIALIIVIQAAGEPVLVVDNPSALQGPLQKVTNDTAHGGEYLAFKNSPVIEPTLGCNVVSAQHSSSTNSTHVADLTFRYTYTNVPNAEEISVKLYSDYANQPNVFDENSVFLAGLTKNYTKEASERQVVYKVLMNYDSGTKVYTAECTTTITIPAKAISALNCTLTALRVAHEINSQTVRFTLSSNLPAQGIAASSIVLDAGDGSGAQNKGSNLNAVYDHKYTRVYNQSPGVDTRTARITLTPAPPYNNQTVTCAVSVAVDKAVNKLEHILFAGYYMDEIAKATSIDGVTFWLNAYHQDLHKRALQLGISTALPTTVFTDPRNAPGSVLFKQRFQNNDGVTGVILLNPGLPSHVTGYKATAQAYLEGISRITVPVYNKNFVSEVLFAYDSGEGTAGFMICDYDHSAGTCRQPGSASWRFGIAIATKFAGFNSDGSPNSLYRYTETVATHEWGHTWHYQNLPYLSTSQLSVWSKNNPPGFTGYNVNNGSINCPASSGGASGAGLRCYNSQLVGFTRGYGTKNPFEDLAEIAGNAFSQSGWFYYGTYDRLYQQGSFAGSGDVYLLAKFNQILTLMRQNDGLNIYDYHYNDIHRAVHYNPKP